LNADELTEQDLKEIHMGQATRRQHKYGKKYKMPISLEQEIKLILHLLKDNTISLCTPFAHIVPRGWNFETACDSCKDEGGGRAQNSPSGGI